jgi:phosphonate metabolim protein, transferase hexapeptide repeat family
MSGYIDNTASVISTTLDDTAKVWKNAFVKNSILGPFVNIGDFSRIEDCKLDSYVGIQRNSLIYSSKIGRHSYTGKNFTMWHTDVGAFCSISWNVGIGGANHDYRKVTTHAFLYSQYMGLMRENDKGYDRFSEPCTIGNDVWIGSNATVCRNVNIGDGAVVGAGAVVTHDVEPYTIVAGIPARPLKKRFDDKTIEKLLEIRWWEFGDEIIRNNFNLFNSEPDEEVLYFMQKIRESIISENINN